MSVKENQRGRSKFEALVKANDLALYTIQICTNEKVFKPEYKSALTNDLIKLAKDIYIHAWAANDINVGKDSGKWRIRKSLQEKAIAECGTLLATIEIAHRLFHLKANRVEFWSNEVLELRIMLRAWHENDGKRYGKL